MGHSKKNTLAGLERRRPPPATEARSRATPRSKRREHRKQPAKSIRERPAAIAKRRARQQSTKRSSREPVAPLQTAADPAAEEEWPENSLAGLPCPLGYRPFPKEWN